jgi:hypothetical protein
MKDNGKLWKMLTNWDQEGYLISGGTPGVDMWSDSDNKKPKEGGLVPGHAYSVIQAIEANNHKLLNVRNPWGNFEWSGDWSDNSDLWTEEMRQLVQPSLDEEDGTFWMSFEDFCANFESLDVSRVSNWDELRLRGKFIRYNDINDPDNEVVVSKWFYALEVPEKSHVIIGLHQEDERAEGTLPRRGYMDMGIALLKRNQEDGSSFLQHRDFQSARDTELETVLEAGSYLVVPRTTGT